MGFRVSDDGDDGVGDALLLPLLLGSVNVNGDLFDASLLPLRLALRLALTLALTWALLRVDKLCPGTTQ